MRLALPLLAAVLFCLAVAGARARAGDDAPHVTGQVALPAGAPPTIVELRVRERIQPDTLPLGMPNWREEGRTVELDATGHFDVPTETRGAVLLQVTAWVGDDLYRGWRILAADQRRDATVRVEKVAPQEVQGIWLVRVVDTRGRPVARVDVDLYTKTDDPFGGCDTLHRKGGPGRFMHRVSLRDGHLWIHVSGATDADREPLPLGGAFGGPYPPGAVTLRLEGSRRLDGVVRTTAGDPVAGAHVASTPLLPAGFATALDARPEDAPDWIDSDASAASDAQGRFSLMGLSTGPQVLTTEVPEGYVAPAPLAVDGRQQAVVVTVRRRMPAKLVVVDPSGSRFLASPCASCAWTTASMGAFTSSGSPTPQASCTRRRSIRPSASTSRSCPRTRGSSRTRRPRGRLVTSASCSRPP